MRCIRIFVTAAITLLGFSANALGPPKLVIQPPDEVWFEATTADSFNENKLTLRCEAEGNPEIYEWRKNNEKVLVDGKTIVWANAPDSGTILFIEPKPTDVGYYQCFVSNIFGTAVSNKVHVQRGVLDHFPQRPVQKITVTEGDSLTINCNPPFGIPKPTVFWLYRDTNQSSVIETIRRPHVTVDPNGNLHFSTIYPHDGRPSLLYECAATSPAMRGEYRAGDHVQIVVKPRHQPIIPPHMLFVSPPIVEVRAGRRLKLMCIVGGRPLPQVEWARLDDNLPKHRIKDLNSVDTDYGRSLIIDNVHPDDAGVYECRVGKLHHQMTVKVTAAPFWVYEAPKDIEQAEDSTAELQCMAAGDPLPLIQWFMNGQPLYEMPDNSRRLLLDAGRVLRLDTLNHDVDTGVYQCNASNPHGYVFANAFVNVKAHAPYFRMPEQQIVKAVRKSAVDLDCVVDAAPNPVVRWVNVNDQPIVAVPGKIQLLANHTLRIFDANVADEGFYYCNVSNKYGLNRASAKLEIYNPTYFIQVPAPKKITVESHAALELKCEAASDPRLNIEYVWSVDGRQINDTSSIEVVNGVSTLKLHDLRGNHSGLIDCNVVTDVDIKVAGTQLLVRDIPDHPAVAKVECASRRAIIRWKEPNSHGSEITRYNVELKTDFEPNKWRLAIEETSLASKDYQALIELSPWVNYTFRVTAFNSYGASEHGYPDDVIPRRAHCMTPRAVPYSNPENVVGFGNEPNNIVISWKPMTKEDWNAPELKYQIRYKLNHPDEEWKEFLIEDPLANSTVIREQPTYQEYLIQVQAVNAEGYSSVEPKTILGFSGEDVPLNAVQNFHLKQFHNFSSVKFGWDAVNPATVRGYFKGYKLVFWETNRPEYMDFHVVPRERLFTTIGGLKAMTNYSACVHVINIGFQSAPSETVSFSTPEGAPSKVHNLRVHAVGSNSVVAMWEEPRHPNGRLRGYFITFQNLTSGQIEETYVFFRQKYYLHESLAPDSSYKVSVWAETNGGEGPKVTKMIKTYPFRAPDAPSFEAKAVTGKTIAISWLPSNGSDWSMPGSSLYVNYSKENSNEWRQTPDIDLPHTDIILDDLEENTNYIVVAVAKEGRRTAEALPIVVFTEGKHSISHINHENLQNAVWFIAILCALAVTLVLICCMCACARQRSGKYAVKRKEIEHGLYASPVSGPTINVVEAEDEHKKFIEYQYGCIEKEPEML